MFEASCRNRDTAALPLYEYLTYLASLLACRVSCGSCSFWLGLVSATYLIASCHDNHFVKVFLALLLPPFSLIAFLNFSLYALFLGVVLSLYPQQGHHNPSHSMNISHIWHLFCPFAYLVLPCLFFALYLRQTSLHFVIFGFSLLLIF